MRRRLVLSVLASFVVVTGLALVAGGVTKPPTLSKAVAQAVAAARQAHDLHRAAHDRGAAKSMDVYVWSVRWLRAAGGTAAQLAAHQKRMQALQKSVDAKFQAGLVAATDVASARFFVAEAQLWRLRGGR